MLTMASCAVGLVMRFATHAVFQRYPWRATSCAPPKRGRRAPSAWRSPRRIQPSSGRRRRLREELLPLPHPVVLSKESLRMRGWSDYHGRESATAGRADKRLEQVASSNRSRRTSRSERRRRVRVRRYCVLSSSPLPSGSLAFRQRCQSKLLGSQHQQIPTTCATTTTSRVHSREARQRLPDLDWWRGRLTVVCVVGALIGAFANVSAPNQLLANPTDTTAPTERPPQQRRPPPGLLSLPRQRWAGTAEEWTAAFGQPDASFYPDSITTTEGYNLVLGGTEPGTDGKQRTDRINLLPQSGAPLNPNQLTAILSRYLPSDAKHVLVY